MSDAAVTYLAGAPTGMAGPVALFIIVLLCVASYFLFRSMSRHLKRVPADFPNDPQIPNPPAERLTPSDRTFPELHDETDRP